MKTSITLILLILLHIPAFSQSVCQGDVVLTTQEEVDAFSCTEVTGTVLITGNSIYNLEALSSLERVGEHFLIVEANNLKNLSGLENLKHVTCSFEIKVNRSIQEISAIRNLQRVGRNLTLIANSSLRSVKGIEQIDSVLNLQVFDNKQLEYCCELAPLIESNGVYGNIEIGGNGTWCRLETVATCDNQICTGDITVSSQADADFFNCKVVEGNLTIGTGSELILDSLYKLEEIQGNLIIQDLSWTFGINGLHNLRTVGGDVIIQNNTHLGNTQGLMNLTSLGGDIRIENNADLGSLAGLENVAALVNLLIQNNPNLDYCCNIDVLIPRATGTVTISENGAYCSDTSFDNCDAAPGECLGDIYVLDQQDADRFACETIRGSFYFVRTSPIDGSQLLMLDCVKDDVFLRLDYKNFDGLTNLVSIGGTLYPLSFKVFGTHLNLDGLSGLRQLGGLFALLGIYDGQLSSLEGTVHYMQLGYATKFSNPDWIPNVEQIDSLVLNDLSESDVDINRLLSALPEDGYAIMRDPSMRTTDLSGLAGKTSLHSLIIDGGNLESLNGMEDLRTLTNLRIRNLYVTEDCCGIYNLLTDGTITGDFYFGENSCTLEDILSGCAPEVVPSSVYPNPAASNEVKIQWTGDDQNGSMVQVLDNSGKVVMETQLEQGAGTRMARLDISRLPRGTFLVRIITGEKAELKRLVRE